MRRAEKVAEAQRLRDEGLTYGQIAERLGYHDGTGVRRLLNPDMAKRYWAKHNRRDGPSGERKRDYERRQRQQREAA